MSAARPDEIIRILLVFKAPEIQSIEKSGCRFIHGHLYNPFRLIIPYFIGDLTIWKIIE